MPTESEWLKIMLDEIRRRQEESRAAREEEEKRVLESPAKPAALRHRPRRPDLSSDL